jgi:hypothetical protein
VSLAVEQDKTPDPINIGVFCVNAVIFDSDSNANTVEQAGFLSHLAVPFQILIRSFNNGVTYCKNIKSSGYKRYAVGLAAMVMVHLFFTPAGMAPATVLHP